MQAIKNPLVLKTAEWTLSVRNTSVYSQLVAHPISLSTVVYPTFAQIVNRILTPESNSVRNYRLK